jgi:hypothetical protein
MEDSRKQFSSYFNFVIDDIAEVATIIPNEPSFHGNDVSSVVIYILCRLQHLRDDVIQPIKDMQVDTLMIDIYLTSIELKVLTHVRTMSIDNHN